MFNICRTYICLHIYIYLNTYVCPNTCSIYAQYMPKKRPETTRERSETMSIRCKNHPRSISDNMFSFVLCTFSCALSCLDWYMRQVVSHWTRIDDTRLGALACSPPKPRLQSLSERLLAPWRLQRQRGISERTA